MPDIESLLKRWQSAGVVDAQTAARIRTWESEQARPSGLRWQGIAALVMGAILLACGVVLFVSAHWDEVSPLSRFSLVLGMVTVFHLVGALTRERFHALSTAMHAVGTISVGAAIALVGQIFNIEEHWPAAIMLWALCALAGWALLRDEAQQMLTLLLIPAWLVSEIAFYTARYIGSDVYTGRFLVVWAVLYLTVFLGTKRKVVHWILFAVSAVVVPVATFTVVERGWWSWQDITAVPGKTLLWSWVLIAAVPLASSCLKWKKSTIPVSAAIATVLALPWCIRAVAHSAYNEMKPSLMAYIVVAAFTLLIVWWGVRNASKALLNLGIIWFAIVVAWFYFSNIFDKIGRSLGLIGLGVLFLAGGWVLEIVRRRLVANIEQQKAAELAAKPEAL